LAKNLVGKQFGKGFFEGTDDLILKISKKVIKIFLTKF
jgi:hypothetical protein